MANDILNQNIKKIGKVDIKNTAYAESLKRTNIEFSNLDSNTAVLEFQITKDNVPAIITEKNAYIYAYFKSNDGNAGEAKEVDYTNAINGIVSVQLDKDFLKAVTGQKVYGELYVTLHQWNNGNLDFSDTVVLSKFDFKVKDALINQISGVTKIEYIRMFDELRDRVRERVNEMEENIGSIETLVDRVDQASTNAINLINDTRTKVFNDIQKLSNDTSVNIKELQEETIARLNNAADKYINDIQNAKTEVVQLIDDEHLITTQKFEAYKDDFTEEINTRLDEYQQFINDNKENFQGILDGLDWQKSKLTKDDGRLAQLNGIDLDNIDATLGDKSQFIYAAGTTNYPPGSNSNGTIMYFVITSTYKRLEYRPNGSNKIFYRRKEGDVWLDWKEITNTQTDTGWIPFQLINSVTKSNAYSGEGDNPFECAYRTIETGGIKRKQIRFNVQNLTQGMNFAQLPEEFVEHTQVAPCRTPRNRYGAIIEIKADGKLLFQYYGDTWTNTDYIYGQYEWTE